MSSNIHYRLRFPNPSDHFIHIERTSDVAEREQVELKMPGWRPGKYQMGDFARNIREWKAFDENGRPLPFRKTDKSTWLVETSEALTLTIQYACYAYKLDAGSCFLTNDLIYVNPITSCIYDPGEVNRPLTLEMEMPADYRTTTAMKRAAKNQFEARDFHELADSPIIASREFEHNAYEIDGYQFHIWFHGTVTPDWEQILADFRKFTREQLNTFASFPVSEYHFFILAPPWTLYHGVEHVNSTVITLGPGYTLMNPENYRRLIGISSHELFHAWNIKNIRPAEMMPYRYNEESNSTLGYIAEGVTTFYGDYYLLRSKVWDFSTYSDKISLVFSRHFNNYGRHYKSLAESSVDTWLDGYEAGIPHRKVSIYIKGCLCALILDILIRRDTQWTSGLDEVFVVLYKQFGMKGKGITQKDYQDVIEQVAGRNYNDYFNRFIYGTEPLETALQDVLNDIGCYMSVSERSAFHESRLGFTLNANQPLVDQIAPDSPASKGGLSAGDELIAVNGIRIDKKPEDLLKYMANGGHSVELTVSSDFMIRQVRLKPDDSNSFYADYTLEKQEEPNDRQRQNFEKWANQSF